MTVLTPQHQSENHSIEWVDLMVVRSYIRYNAGTCAQSVSEMKQIVSYKLIFHELALRHSGRVCYHGEIHTVFEVEEFVEFLLYSETSLPPTLYGSIVPLILTVGVKTMLPRVAPW